MLTQENRPIAALPTPPFEHITHIEITLPSNGDRTDLYYPALSSPEKLSNPFPIVLLLQGANVDKSVYTEIASLIARYGFVVAVPNHLRTLTIPGNGQITGLFAEEHQLNDLLSDLETETTTPSSPLYKLVNPRILTLIGHSFGGVAGLNALLGLCVPPFCFGAFQRPPALKAAVFYGTALRDARSGGPITSLGNLPYPIALPPQSSTPIPPLDNQGIPVGLIRGSADGATSPFDIEETYRQLTTPPKALITVFGANHYGPTDRNNPPGSIPDPNSPTLDQANSIETIGRWCALFLQAYALHDRDALNYVQHTGPQADPNVSVQQESKTRPVRLLLEIGLGILTAIFIGFSLQCR